MSVNILKNAVFVNPIKNPDKIQYEVILTPSADTIRISFYGKNPHTLELFRDTYMNKAVHALSTYFFDVAGAEKSHQLAIINIDHIDSMEIKKINTINIWASLLLAIVSTLSFLFVHIIVWSNTNE
ncbi:hypothetical protein SAMN05660299_00008 [Megasphaera paucivorans]|uniref:Uncharacterized protein n=2 Tax=Megasphaera paucivorans TaxID=349095 RepID=A0A1G9PUW9_9FIRM|nr:hypothetical protein SAMN05660299_00008 [Megasphaera paucivorans]